MRELRQRKAVIEPSEAIKHLVFVTLRPDFARHFAFDAGDVIEIVPVIAGLKLHTRGAEIARSFVPAKSTCKISVILMDEFSQADGVLNCHTGALRERLQRWMRCVAK